MDVRGGLWLVVAVLASWKSSTSEDERSGKVSDKCGLERMDFFFFIVLVLGAESLPSGCCGDAISFSLALSFFRKTFVPPAVTVDERRRT
jgi:hypothetical protein